MRLLLDESVPAKLRRYLPDHDVRSAVDMGWSGVKNGQLLALAGQHFDVLITVDKNMPFQQNLSTLPVALIVLDTLSNELRSLLPLLPELERALATIQPRSCAVVRSAT